MGNFADVVRRIEAIFLARQYTSARSSGAISKGKSRRNLDFQSRNKSHYSTVKHVIYSTLFKSSRIIKRAARIPTYDRMSRGDSFRRGKHEIFYHLRF